MNDASQIPPIEPIVPTEADSDARMWGMLCHLTALSVYFTGVGCIVGPLICWLIKKDQYPFVDACGKESLNFQISMLIYTAVAGLLSCVFIGIPMLIALGITDVVLVIIASMKTYGGEFYRYPLTIRLLK